MGSTIAAGSPPRYNWQGRGRLPAAIDKSGTATLFLFQTDLLLNKVSDAGNVCTIELRNSQFE
jgi:hypothetical protein